MIRRRKANALTIVLIVLGILAVLAVVCAGVLMALLLPAVSAARDAARRVNSMNQMKQIEIALHNYHDTYGTFPPAVVKDAEGNPLYSWRVLILPYMEAQFVYEQFNLEEPWNSAANRTLAEQNGTIYESARLDRVRPGYTTYKALVGPKTVINSDEPVEIRQIVAGTSNTIMIVEDLNHPVFWSDPVDVSPEEFMARFVSEPTSDGGYLIGTADGAVQFFETENAGQVSGMTSIDGN